MNWAAIKSRLFPKHGVRTGSFLLPSVVLDLQPGFIAGARLDRKSRQVRRVAVRQIEDGALDPLAARPNLVKQEVVRRAIREVLETVGDRNERLGVLLPDPSVRVAVLRFETLSSRREEAEALVRWKIGSFLPFPPEEARVSYQLLSKSEQSVEVLAMAVRRFCRHGIRSGVGGSGRRAHIGSPRHSGPSPLASGGASRKPGSGACLFGFGDLGRGGGRRYQFLAQSSVRAGHGGRG